MNGHASCIDDSDYVPSKACHEVTNACLRHHLHTLFIARRGCSAFRGRIRQHWFFIQNISVQAVLAIVIMGHAPRLPWPEVSQVVGCGIQDLANVAKYASTKKVRVGSLSVGTLKKETAEVIGTVRGLDLCCLLETNEEAVFPRPKGHIHRQGLAFQDLLGKQQRFKS